MEIRVIIPDTAYPKSAHTTSAKKKPINPEMKVALTHSKVLLNTFLVKNPTMTATISPNKRPPAVRLHKKNT